MHPRSRQQLAAGYAPQEARRRAAEEAEKTRAEQYERKLIREIEEEDAALDRLADPPPQLSPSEARERELAERLDRLEGKARAERQPPVRLNMDLVSRQNRRRDELRLLRNRLDAERETKRNQDHVKRCGKQIKALEQQVAESDAALQAERTRHEQAMAELNAERTRVVEKLTGLNRALEPNETSELRLKAVMADDH
jgi:chromosome segregation ATPase